MKVYDIWASGTPKALKRHRTVILKNGKRLNYDPSKEDKLTFIDKIIKYAPEQPLQGPISLEIWFSMPRPKNHFRTGRYAGTIKDNAPFWCTKRPDLDNYIKFIMDALNGIYFYDDSQIVIIIAKKSYSEKPGVNIHIVSLEE